MPKIAEDDVKRSGKGSKMEPEGVPKVDKIDEKNGVWKRSKNLEKKKRGSEALRRTNRGKHIIRATPPTHPDRPRWRNRRNRTSNLYSQRNSTPLLAGIFPTYETS